jgi:hypothetical protein
MKTAFASGGKRPMLGKGGRTKSAYPATPQKPGKTGQHNGKSAAKRTGAKVRSGTVSNSRRPAA